MFMNDWKQTGKRLKLQDTTNNQLKKYILVKHLETTIFMHEDKYLSVSKTSESLSLKFKFML